GPAPLWSGDVPGQPLAARPTGDFVFNAPSSMLFAPAVTMPLLAVGGLPVGVQLMGQQHGDGRGTAMARWMLGAIAPVSGSGEEGAHREERDMGGKMGLSGPGGPRL